MAETPVNKPLEALIAQSQATPEFKEAARDLARGGSPDRIKFNWGSPPVKALRVTKKILESYPDLPIERVEIQGASGCSNFTGSAVIQPGDLTVRFDWDCRWQAERLGWTDYYGDPDQSRAAREFDYQCFRIFEPARASAPQPS